MVDVVSSRVLSRSSLSTMRRNCGGEHLWPGKNFSGHLKQRPSFFRCCKASADRRVKGKVLFDFVKVGNSGGAEVGMVVGVGTDCVAREGFEGVRFDLGWNVNLVLVG